MNFTLQTSSPVTAEGLPSPILTEPNLSSPKNETTTTVHGTTTSTNPTGSNTFSVPTPSTSTSSASPILSAMLRSIPKSSKELNITEYSNKELKSMKKRCRTVMTPAQSRILRKVLEQTAFPSTEIRENLAKILGMKPRTVQIWFQNQRQKSRQGRSSDDLTAMIGSPNDSNSDENVTDIDDPLSSPIESSNSNSTTSPGFTALTAAAFALSNSNTSLESTSPVTTVPPTSADQQRYSTFHGAVYKSIPGCMPMNTYRGNTAAAMNAKRLSVGFIPGAGGSSQTTSFPVQGQGQAPPPPNQPQKIPSYNNNNFSSAPRGEAISLDILASAVSNFRPNGYNYYMKAPPNRVPTMVSPDLQVNNRNRLAPLRTPSPPTTASIALETIKLPSLKDLAQVASIGIEQFDQPQIQQRSKSLVEILPPSTTNNSKIQRRFSTETSVISNLNVNAPNNHSSTASLRRPCSLSIEDSGSSSDDFFEIVQDFSISSCSDPKAFTLVYNSFNHYDEVIENNWNAAFIADSADIKANPVTVLRIKNSNGEQTLILKKNLKFINKLKELTDEEVLADAVRRVVKKFVERTSMNLQYVMLPLGTPERIINTFKKMNIVCISVSNKIRNISRTNVLEYAGIIVVDTKTGNIRKEHHYNLKFLIKHANLKVTPLRKCIPRAYEPVDEGLETENKMNDFVDDHKISHEDVHPEPEPKINTVDALEIAKEIANDKTEESNGDNADTGAIVTGTADASGDEETKSSEDHANATTDASDSETDPGKNIKRINFVYSALNYLDRLSRDESVRRGVFLIILANIVLYQISVKNKQS